MISEYVRLAADELGRKFGTVRQSSAVTKEQLLVELQSIPRTKLPAVIVCTDAGAVEDSGTVMTLNLGFVIVAPFAANMDNRVRGVLETLDAFLELFPPGRARRLRAPGGLWADVFLQRFYPVDVAKDFAAFAIETEMKTSA